MLIFVQQVIKKHHKEDKSLDTKPIIGIYCEGKSKKGFIDIYFQYSNCVFLHGKNEIIFSC